MSAARERVLAGIRRSLNRTGPIAPAVAAALERRLADPPAPLQPTFDEDPVERFMRKSQAVNATTAHIGSLAGVSRAVARYIDAHSLSDDIVVAPGLEGISWSNRFAIERRAAIGSDQTSVTGAFAGIAETGSVVLMSGPDHPTTLNFVPENHLVVLVETRIVRHLEDAWRLIRQEFAALPRTVNLVTGPSKTGDVAQVIQEGAHGPRRVHVIVVKAPRATRARNAG